MKIKYSVYCKYVITKWIIILFGFTCFFKLYLTASLTDFDCPLNNFLFQLDYSFVHSCKWQLARLYFWFIHLSVNFILFTFDSTAFEALFVLTVFNNFLVSISLCDVAFIYTYMSSVTRLPWFIVACKLSLHYTRLFNNNLGIAEKSFFIQLPLATS